MNNLVLITSVICTPNIPLSYISYRSVFTHEERFEQTKKTIESIREKIPNTKIFIVECSHLNSEQNNYFIKHTDFFLNLYYDENIRQNVYSVSKSLGEGTMTYRALEYIINNNIPYDNLIKISGRYWLSDNFNYNNFENSNIVIKYIDNNLNNVFTALFKLPKESVLNFKLFLESKFDEMMNCIGYEVLFAIFIDEAQQTVNVTHLNPIGLEGFISVSVENEFYTG
jgi:hypothetical protein